MTERGLKILAQQKLFPRIKGIEFKFGKHYIMGRHKRVSFIRNGSKMDT